MINNGLEKTTTIDSQEDMINSISPIELPDSICEKEQIVTVEMPEDVYDLEDQINSQDQLNHITIFLQQVLSQKLVDPEKVKSRIPEISSLLEQVTIMTNERKVTKSLEKYSDLIKNPMVLMKYISQECIKEIQKIQSLLLTLEQTIQTLKKQNKQYSQRCQSYQEILKEKQQMFLLSKQSKQEQLYKQQIAQLQRQLQCKTDYLNYFSIIRLFQNQILEQQYNHKKFLKEALENRYHVHIKASRILFSYKDHDEKENFHKYTDKRQNVLVVVRMKNGTFLAAFTMDPFEEGRVSQRDGILISLTNQQVFSLVEPNRRAITYEKRHLIFGNSDLLITKNQVRSNFGTPNSYYNSRGKGVEAFLGGEGRIQQAEDYEVYQLVFETVK